MNSFYVCNEKEIHNLNELLEELKVIDDGAFCYHVNDEKNDFANWVEGEVKDKILARKLGKIRNKDKMIEAIDRRVNNDAKRKQLVISQIKEAIQNE